MKRSLAFAAFALATLAGGHAVVAQDQSPITPTARELNKSFDADIDQWAERFEHEGRAIYDKRSQILE